MPRLDAERVALFRALGVATSTIARRIDAELVERCALPLTWFEVLAALHSHGGELRVGELCDVLGDVASSLSRRLDRLEEHGWVARSALGGSADRRAVVVRLTPHGRLLWRDANVVFRRGVQEHFAKDLSATDVAALQRILGKLRPG